MKIFAITDNYRNAEIPEDRTPGWRFLPDSSVFRAPNPFFLEEETDLAAAFPTLAVRIDRLGKSIAERFAERYTTHIAQAVNLRNLTLEERLRSEGLPLDPAWGYDRSVLLSDWIEVPFETMKKAEITVRLSEGGAIRWETSELRFGLENIISRVSLMNTLKMGDIILVGFHRNGLVLTPDSILKTTLSLPSEEGISESVLEIPIR